MGKHGSSCRIVSNKNNRRVNGIIERFSSKAAAFLPYIIRKDNVTITTLSLRVTESCYSSDKRRGTQKSSGDREFYIAGHKFPLY